MQVLDQNVDEVKDVELESLGDVTFEQIMDEYDQKVKDDQEKPESSFDMESEIKFIKSFKADEATTDNLLETLAGVANDTLHASADVPAQSDPLGIQTSVPSLVADELKEHLLGLVSEALNSSFPELIKDSIKQTIKKSIKKKMPMFDVQVQFVILQKELMKKSSEENTSAEMTSAQNVSDEEPPIKKLKFLISTPTISSQTPLRSVLPKHLKKPDVVKMTVEQFTDHLVKTTSYIFSPTPPRDQNPPRDPTSPRDESKGKGIATKEPLKELIPFMEEGGSEPKMPNLKSFSTSDGQITTDDVKAQLKEIKRLVKSKAEKEKSELSIKKVMNPATLRAQAWKLVEYEAKRAKMLDDYNKHITHKADKLPITKISYKINSSKEATIRITRNNNPLNLMVYEEFRLKTLGFSVLPPPELSTFGVLVNEKKRKTSSKILKEVFVTEDIVVDGIHRNLAPPLGVEGTRGLVIKEPESWIFFYNNNFDLVFQREEEFHLATTAQLIRLQNAIQKGTPKVEELFKKMELTVKDRNDVTEAKKVVKDNLDGFGQHILVGCKASASGEVLAECKASASNLRRIQVKDIIKEVEDYLKTYSSAGMDISWYIEGIQCGSKESQMWQYFDIPVTI
ncbi:hypothetical protein Tco_1012939 [Tanacetum coccineum]